MSDNWYECVLPTAPVTQGDMITACPVVTWKEEVFAPGTNYEEALRNGLTVTEMDVVVLTQACDLEHNHVRNVTVCPHSSLSSYKSAWEAALKKKSQNPSNRAWGDHCDDLRNGYIWNSAMLNAGVADGLETQHRVVDFRDIFTVPRNFVESLLEFRAESRLRLRSPYREHLSQAFARFFMRVGLPASVDKAW